MAHEQRFTIWKRAVGGINLFHGVGLGRSNLLSDVMAVQAMFNFIVDSEGDASKVGLESSQQLPPVNGFFDTFLDKTIVAFQRKNAHLLRLDIPGTVSPVSDPFDLAEDDLWPTILLLNQFAEDATAIARNGTIETTGGRDSGVPYPASMYVMFPELRKQLKYERRN